MTKPVGIVSIPTDLGFAATGELLLKSSGRNTGNLLFTSAVYSHFKKPVHLPFRFADRVEEINEEFAGVVIPAANWINAGEDWGFLADTLEKITVPVACIGLGAEISLSEVHRIEAGTIRFLKTLSHKSAIIGTRGAVSTEILSELGIRNSAPIGCPSVFPRLQKPDSVPFNYKKNGMRFSISQTRYERNDYLASSQQFLARLAARKAHSIVIQSEKEEINALLDHDASNYEWLAKYYGISMTHLHSLLAKLHVFRTAEEWIAFHKANTDFTISSRIHGCIASLMAGKPALLLHYNQRVRELAETMGVSSISLEKAKSDSGLLFSRDRLLSRDYLRAHYDERSFAVKAEKNLASLLDFYKKNGFEVIGQQ